MSFKARRNIILLLGVITSLGLIGYITKGVDEVHFTKYERI
jgi:hypothetical protein